MDLPLAMPLRRTPPCPASSARGDVVGQRHGRLLAGRRPLALGQRPRAFRIASHSAAMRSSATSWIPPGNQLQRGKDATDEIRPPGAAVLVGSVYQRLQRHRTARPRSCPGGTASSCWSGHPCARAGGVVVRLRVAAPRHVVLVDPPLARLPSYPAKRGSRSAPAWRGKVARIIWPACWPCPRD